MRITYNPRMSQANSRAQIDLLESRRFLTVVAPGDGEPGGGDDPLPIVWTSSASQNVVQEPDLGDRRSPTTGIIVNRSGGDMSQPLTVNLKLIDHPLHNVEDYQESAYPPAIEGSDFSHDGLQVTFEANHSTALFEITALADTATDGTNWGQHVFQQVRQGERSDTDVGTNLEFVTAVPDDGANYTAKLKNDADQDVFGYAVIADDTDWYASDWKAKTANAPQMLYEAVAIDGTSWDQLNENGDGFSYQSYYQDRFLLQSELFAYSNSWGEEAELKFSLTFEESQEFTLGAELGVEKTFKFSLSPSYTQGTANGIVRDFDLSKPAQDEFEKKYVRAGVKVRHVFAVKQEMRNFQPQGSSETILLMSGVAPGLEVKPFVWSSDRVRLDSENGVIENPGHFSKLREASTDTDRDYKTSVSWYEAQKATGLFDADNILDLFPDGWGRNIEEDTGGGQDSL